MRQFIITIALVCGAMVNLLAAKPVTVVPEETSVIITWPKDANAEKYHLDIFKDSVRLFRITLGPTGQVLAYENGAPSSAPIASPRLINAIYEGMADTQPSDSLSFKATGLEKATLYHFILSAVDNNDKPLHVYIGRFCTKGNDLDIDQGGDEVLPTPPIIPYSPFDDGKTTAIQQLSTSSTAPSTKILRHGRLYLQSHQHTYTLTGQRVR